MYIHFCWNKNEHRNSHVSYTWKRTDDASDTCPILLIFVVQKEWLRGTTGSNFLTLMTFCLVDYKPYETKLVSYLVVWHVKNLWYFTHHPPLSTWVSGLVSSLLFLVTTNPMRLSHLVSYLVVWHVKNKLFFSFFFFFENGSSENAGAFEEHAVCYWLVRHFPTLLRNGWWAWGHPRRPL